MVNKYTKEDLVKAFLEVGIKQGDLIFSHSNIGFFGIPEGCLNVQETCEMIFDAILEVIGDRGTLVVPTFTYSFPNGKPFNPHATPSTCGAFTEYVRQRPDAFRTRHPCISVAAVGANAANLTQNVPVNGYEEDSFFGRFYKSGGKIVNMNMDAGSTFVHYVERQLRVPYRFDKEFAGELQIEGESLGTQCVIWVRDLSSAYTEAEFSSFAKLAVKNEQYRKAIVGRGFVGCITAADTFDLIEQTLKKRPWFLTKAENAGVVPKLECCPK